MAGTETVTKEMCDTKHGELMRTLSELRATVMRVAALLEGNGKPGFRQTQDEVERLKERQAEALKAVWRKINEDEERADRELADVIKRRDSWLFFVLRPLLPLLYAAVFAGVYVSFVG